LRGEPGESRKVGYQEGGVLGVEQGKYEIRKKKEGRTKKKKKKATH